jgi:ATP-dependent helicase HrpA
MSQKFAQYNCRLKTRSRELRKNMTRAEVRLWIEVLQKRQLLGYKFLRQKPIENYIVDFYCQELKLVIEVDGSQHVKNREYDEIRTKVINSHGIKVIRYWNNEVMSNLEGVYEDLVSRIQAHKISPE